MIELVFSLSVVLIVATAVISSGVYVQHTVRSTKLYAQLRTRASNILEQMLDDIESGTGIYPENYEDSGISSGVRVKADVRELGTAFDKPCFFVVLRLTARGSDAEIQTSAVLREGVSIHASDYQTG